LRDSKETLRNELVPSYAPSETNLIYFPWFYIKGRLLIGLVASFYENDKVSHEEPLKARFNHIIIRKSKIQTKQITIRKIEAKKK